MGNCLTGREHRLAVCHLLKIRKLAEQIPKICADLLVNKKPRLHTGIIVDATLIAAPNSTKNSSDVPQDLLGYFNPELFWSTLIVHKDSCWNRNRGVELSAKLCSIQVRGDFSCF